MHLIDGIQAIPGTTVHGITNPNRVGERVPTVSMTHECVLPPLVAECLARDGVCVWSGHNYALEVVRHLGMIASRRCSGRLTRSVPRGRFR